MFAAGAADALDLGELAALVPQDPAVLAGLGVIGGQHRHGVAVGVVVRHELAQRVHHEQGDVPVGHQHSAAHGGLGVEDLEARVHGGTGTGDVRLVRGQDLGIHGRDVLGHEIALVTDHGHDALRRELAGHLQGVAEHGTTPDLMQDLGGLGLHAGALTRGQDDDGGGVLPGARGINGAPGADSSGCS